MSLKPRKRENSQAITDVALGHISNNEEFQPDRRSSTALETARSVNPRLPPAEMQVDDEVKTLNIRVRISTLKAIQSAAENIGMSSKQFIMTCLFDQGVKIAEKDLHNGAVKKWIER